jgi:putative ubiquitin-RnfH superfamily antitoxin RatB of RatAB toxin-antitoxin module
MHVEVVYALADQQHVVDVEIETGATVRQAIEQSRLLEEHPEIDLDKDNKVGVYGKLAKLDQSLRPGDRVEIYRPLIADPKEVRKQRAKEGKQMRSGAG